MRHHDAVHASGPFKSLNPTKRYFAVDKRLQRPAAEEEAALPPFKAAAYLWSSRDNRKGRHAVVLHRDPRDEGSVRGPKPSNSWEQTFRGIAKMFVRFPVWDVSYDVAVVFTMGSAVWVVNGFFSWMPVEDPSSKFSGETTWGAGLTAFVGATVFEFGSVLLMLEAVNEMRTECFGWAVEESLDGILHLRSNGSCHHPHPHKRSFVRGEKPNGSENGRPPRSWSWWPGWHEIKTHYLREIGFLACFSQMVGATIFWIAGISSIPPILNNLSKPVENGVYWAPQVIGGCGFIISSALFMIEVQPRWYVPAPGVLGWHVGFWNLIGAVGFTLCGALGFGISQPSVEYAATLSTYIGSWAFLIGSAVQWFESLNKYPIWVDENVGRLVRTNA